MMHEQPPQNAAEVLHCYEAQGKPAEMAKVRTALLRYTLPGWTEVYPTGRKFSRQEVDAALTALAGISVEQLTDALRVQAQVFDKVAVTASSRSLYRFCLQQFLTWCQSQDWFATVESSQNETQDGADIRSRRRVLNRCPPRQFQGRMVVARRARRLPYQLKMVAEAPIPESLTQEVEALLLFCRQELRLRDRSSKHTHDFIYQWFGWQHRQHGVALDELGIDEVIPVVPLRLRAAEVSLISEYQALEQTQLSQMTQLVEQVMQQVEAYLEFVGGSWPHQVNVLKELVHVAKYQYRHETNPLLYGNYKDVPIIQALRQRSLRLRRERSKEPQRVPFECKSVPWTQAIQVMLALKQNADRMMRGNRENVRRSLSAIASDYRRFLMVAFLVLMPPDRSRTLVEMEVGRTLVKGRFQGGCFVSAEQLAQPEQAEWYIHLTPDDYKTGDVYGEFWGEVPDYRFEDGTTFYGYIDRWLTVYRLAFQPSCPRFFVQSTGKPLCITVLCAVVRGLFLRYTGVPVTPKELRRMYVTMLYEQGATEPQKEAAACAMHHSRAMQAQVYNQLDAMRMTQPIREFNAKLAREFLRE